MSEAPTPAGAITPIPPAPAPAADPVAITSSVVQSVTSHPAIPPQHAASVIVSILNDLAQVAPAIFAVSRASQKTQTQVGLGLGIAELLVQSFLHHNSQ